MGNKIRRPLSVWIAQILLALLASFLLVMSLLPFAYLFASPSLDIRVPILMIVLLIIFLSVIAFWGMAQRSPYGRWLGVGILSVTLIFAVRELIFVIHVVQINEFSPGWSDIPFTFFIPGVMAVLLLSLVANLILSKKVASFFAQIVEEPVMNSPLPPSFDA